MGLIHPPWISANWFKKCPFNYCDHFADQKVTAKCCLVCKEDVARKEKYAKVGKDPYDWSEVMKDVAENLAKSMVMLHKMAKKDGIDLDNFPDDENTTPPVESYMIYQLVWGYGNEVEKIIKELSPVNEKYPTLLLETVIDILAHSRSYILAKTARALNSRYEEQTWDAEWKDELADSKTSALFTYMAIDRNIRAMISLARNLNSLELKTQFLEFAQMCKQVRDQIKKEFFPEEKVDLSEEIGCEYLDEILGKQKVLN